MKSLEARPAWRKLAWALGVAGSLLLAGCQPAAQSGGGGDPANDPLEAMRAAYQKAKSYADAAALHMQAFEKGKQVDGGEVPFSVAFQRPDKLRVEAFRGSVVCDGKHFWAALNDKQSFAGQVLMLEAPSELTPKFVYADAVLQQMLDGGFEIGLPQLELLLGENPLTAIFGAGYKSSRLEDKTLEQAGDKYRCRLVKITGEGGDYTLWIDAKSHVLRRLELPSDRFERKYDPSGDTSLRLWVDFTGAQLNKPIQDAAFEFQAPSSAKLLTRFVPPPAELTRPPSKLLGQRAVGLKLTDASGQTVDLKSLEGKPAVLDFWSVTCGPCFMSFPNLQKVYDRYQDQVTFLAVNCDELTINDATLADVFKRAGLHLPIARDPGHDATEVLAVQAWPTMVVLGPDGTVQDYELGYRPTLAEVLPQKLEKVLAGGDLWRETLLRYDHLKQQFERRLEEFAVKNVERQIELPQAVVAEPSEPKTLKLTRLWTAVGIKNPGNLLVVADASGAPRIVALDGWRTVVELDAAGRALARHEIEVPSASALTLLRTGVDGAGQRTYAAFTSSQAQAHLFDSDWKLISSYPAERARGGVADVQLGDLDGDGKLEVNVAYFGPVGVQSASLDGQRLWSNRSEENVLSLAVLNADADGHRRLLSTNERDAIGVIDFDGQSLPDIRLPDRAAEFIVAADLDGQAPIELAAITASDPVTFAVTGVDLEGHELWSYPLPLGVRKTPCEILVSGRVRLGGAGQWLLTGADGSIHILAADGTLIDKFNYGAELTGIGTAEIDGRPVLLVASTRELVAWAVESSEESAAAESSATAAASDLEDSQAGAVTEKSAAAENVEAADSAPTPEAGESQAGDAESPVAPAEPELSIGSTE